MKIHWSDEAQSDLFHALDFIAYDSLDASEGVLDRILASVGHLEKFPSMGRSGRVPGTRELVIAGLPFVIPYVIDRGEVAILRVYHTSQDWPND